MMLPSGSRFRQLHRQLAEISDARDPRGWLLSSLATLGDSLPSRPSPYVISDGQPHFDTFMAWQAPPPPDRAAALVEAVLAVVAARQSLIALDGELPEQPLRTTLDRRVECRSVPSELRYAAFVLDGQTWIAELSPELCELCERSERSEPREASGELSRIASPLLPLAALVNALAEPLASPLLMPLATSPHVPFVTACLDGETPELVRHTHRHGWLGERGPWLGLGRGAELRAVTTSHFAVDGYGHAWLTAGIASRSAELLSRHGAALRAAVLAAHPEQRARLLGPDPGQTVRLSPPPGLTELPAPLGLAWRVLPSGTPAPRAIPLAYRFAQLLARKVPALGPAAGRSPTIGLPIAPGDKDDPLRLRRRVGAAVIAVRYEHGQPEPFDEFAARAAATIASEASGAGMLATLRRATANLPLPLRWKRQVIGGSSGRSRWMMGDLPAALGGRGCLSVIRLREWTSPPLVAVSSPAILAGLGEPIGSCVVTLVDDGERAMITASGSGLAGDRASAAALLDELLAP